MLQQHDYEIPNIWATVGNWSKTLNKKRCKYSETKCRCYLMDGAVMKLRSSVEGSHFIVRTERNEIPCMLILNSPQEPMMKWHHRLMTLY